MAHFPDRIQGAVGEPLVPGILAVQELWGTFSPRALDEEIGGSQWCNHLRRPPFLPCWDGLVTVITSLEIKSRRQDWSAEDEVAVVLAIHIGTRWDFTRKVILESRSKRG